MSVAEDVLGALVDLHAPKARSPETWDFGAIRRAAADLFALDQSELAARVRDDDARRDHRCDSGEGSRAVRGQGKSLPGDASILRRVERDIMLQIVDAQWKDHLYGLDHLKEGIGLRGYGQRDPLVESKKESFALFQAMKDRIDEEIVRYLWRIRPVVPTRAKRPRRLSPPPRKASAHVLQRRQFDHRTAGGGAAGPHRGVRRWVRAARRCPRAPAVTMRR